MDKTQQMWDERYGAEAWAYGTTPNIYFRDKLMQLVPGKILLPAEGEGRNAAFATSRNWQVDAFDLSIEGKKKADRLAADMGRSIRYQVADANVVDYPANHFDVLGFSYAHFPSALRAMIYPKLAASVKSGGHIILECFGKKQLEYQPHQASGGPREADLLLDLEEIRSYFPDFEILELLEGEVYLEEGLYHRGQGWVCRFFGRKR